MRGSPQLYEWTTKLVEPFGTDCCTIWGYILQYIANGFWMRKNKSVKRRYQFDYTSVILTTKTLVN